MLKLRKNKEIFMPAIKWDIDIQEIMEWIIRGEQEFAQIMMNFDLKENIKYDSNSPEKIKSDKEGIKDSDIPNVLPILPLRGLVVYPQTAVPLTIGQPRSIKLVDESASSNRWVGLVTTRKPDIERPNSSDLYQYGTAALIHRLFRAPDGTIRLLVQGVSRFKIKKFLTEEPYITAEVLPQIEIIETGLEIEALTRNVRDQFMHIAEILPSIPRELVATINSLDDPLQIAYNIANMQKLDIESAQNLLELDSVIDKLHLLVGLLTKETEVLDLGKKIQNEAREEIDKVQREYFLKEQLKAIQKELGEEDSQTSEVNEFRDRIAKADLPPEPLKQAKKELERLSGLPTAAAEYGVIRTYLDWIVSLPWKTTDNDNLNIKHAIDILDKDHYGLEEVKNRIIEFLAVRKLKLERSNEIKNISDDIRKPREGVILCFVGPPGVGKTSLGQSIAKALNRKFIRASLGGIRDEAEIRGHRRTYIGAMPGRILQSLRRIESNNPVFMLDEIDKLGNDFRGDPSSALLEVLDPEQNFEFRDNYLEVAYDLSQTMFITTANQLDSIPTPLLDRMEVIQLSGYTENEKVQIAQGYLVPRQLKENGLREKELKFKDEALLEIIRSYTRESGVRNLERNIGAVCRKVVTLREKSKKRIRSISIKYVRDLLGRPKFSPFEEIVKRTSVPGVATGLAWTPVGGQILFIEATSMPGNKDYKITGSIGDVMRESADAALSFLRSHAQDFGISKDIFKEIDIHVHIPSGAQPKDGPSAGITIVAALASLLSGKSIHPEIGMTGEISLRGRILPVGGIKEKMLAAHRVGLKKIFLPVENIMDLDDLPDEIRDSIEFIGVATISEVIKQVL
jgi:ATP-dependent Lon protease